MDVVETITSVEAIDLLVFFALFGMFILGFMQGIIRRLLGIASILISLLLAAQIRSPLGDFLAQNWTQYPPDYNRMIAFGTVFLAGSIASTIAIQLFFRPIPLFAQYPLIDEIVGGVLGVIQAGLILGRLLPHHGSVLPDDRPGCRGERVPVRARDPPGVRRVAHRLDRPRADRTVHPPALRWRVPAGGE